MLKSCNPLVVSFEGLRLLRDLVSIGAYAMSVPTMSILTYVDFGHIDFILRISAMTTMADIVTL